MVDIDLKKELPVITMNFEEVKASLIAGSEKYKNLVVTEDGLKDCKIMQKELSRTKKDLDTYRKNVKGEMMVPVTKFEDQCKELIKLVVEVEDPLKEGISVFDNKVREKKRVVAQEQINEAIKELELNEKYSSMLSVIDEYMGLAISAKKVREDIERRSLLLQQQQQQEIENIQIIKNTIETVNKNIDAKIEFDDFKSLIETQTISTILSNINNRVERIKANELKAIADKAAAAEKEVLERIAKAEREAAEKARIEERNKKFAQDAIENTERLRLKAAYDAKIKANAPVFQRQEVSPSEESKYAKEITPPAKEEIRTKEKLYFIDMKIINATLTEVKTLSQFLKDNNYKYETTNKGLM